MNIQIFGKSKCFDTKKAERYFKERRIKYQMVDLIRFGMSGKEFDSVLRNDIAGDDYEDDIADYGKKLDCDVNEKATKQFKVKKIVYPES